MHIKYKSWIKHLDFIILDIFCISVSLYLAYFFRFVPEDKFLSPAHMCQNRLYRLMAIFMVVVHICSALLSEYYSRILYRGYFIEFRKVLTQNIVLAASVLFYFFAVQAGEQYSRVIVVMFFLFDLFFMYLAHVVRKSYLINRKGKTKKQSKLLVYVNEENAKQAIRELTEGPDSRFNIVGVALAEENSRLQSISGIPVVSCGKKVFDFAIKNVVDSVMIYTNRNDKSTDEVATEFLNMGIPVQIKVDVFIKDMDKIHFSNINSVNTIVVSHNTVSMFQMMIKRTMDIVAGIIGCLITLILLPFVGTAIKIADPKGPIFFSQERIGKNGRKFKIHKFRSMYADAEERKKELMDKNKMEGLMFKLDADPRIIGSGPDGMKKGLGHFLRASSIDEFPNFWSILKGDMSLVGTRPPTLDEYEKYETHHKSRLAAKPGLTGMWQVSGRSNMTDFEEIVKLDSEYIRNWDLGKDIKIILKTIWVVLARKGSQ